MQQVVPQQQYELIITPKGLLKLRSICQALGLLILVSINLLIIMFAPPKIIDKVPLYVFSISTILFGIWLGKGLLSWVKKSFELCEEVK